MSHLVHSFPFYLGGPTEAVDANGCWIGASSEFELRLMQPFDTYALEQLRLRFMFTLTTNHDPVKSARVLLQMAFETEAGVILVKQLDKPPGLYAYKVCERRRYIDVDQDMHKQRYLIGPALDDLEAIPGMPGPYMDFITRYLVSDYPRYRMSALAVAICVAKVLQE